MRSGSKVLAKAEFPFMHVTRDAKQCDVRHPGAIDGSSGKNTLKAIASLNK